MKNNNKQEDQKTKDIRKISSYYIIKSEQKDEIIIKTEKHKYRKSNIKYHRNAKKNIIIYDEENSKKMLL